PVPISIASSPSPLTLSSISSRDSFSYTGSKTPIGIFRRPALPACTRLDSAWLGMLVVSAGFAPPGIAAASRPPPVAAPNSLRWIPEDWRLLFIRFFLGITTADTLPKPAALYDALPHAALSTICGRQGVQRRNGGRHGKQAFGQTLALLNGLHKHFDGLPGVRRNKD